MMRNAEADVEDLVQRLLAMARAFDQARELGLPVSIPPELYRACMAIVRTRDDGNGSGPGTPLALGDALHDVPLRKLLFQVIEPGESFTVPDIAKRLRSLGVDAPANKISNALSSWVTSGRLERERKGVYFCPPAGSPAGRADQGHPITSSGKESISTDGGTQKKKAV